MMKRVSLKDIAKQVGVSTALVSYVLNNKKEGRISKEVAQKIKDAAKELNYTANQIARSLKTNKTFTIGLIVSDISNPFSSALNRIIEDEAEKHNYLVLSGSSDESSEKIWKLTRVLQNYQVDGFIISPAENSASLVQYLQEQNIPFVLIDRYFPEIQTNYVTIDNYKAAYSAVKHLIENGYRQIGLVGLNIALFNMQERRRGYMEALKEHGLPVKEDWIKRVSRDHVREAVPRAIDELMSLDEPVDAVLFTNNVVSTQALKYINTLPIRVPDDLAIVSFDESDAADLFYAPITHIKQPLVEIGQLATNILLENIVENKELRQVKMEAKLIVRKSTERKGKLGRIL
jgi:LacI family transcriptional regulator